MVFKIIGIYLKLFKLFNRKCEILLAPVANKKPPTFTKRKFKIKTHVVSKDGSRIFYFFDLLYFLKLLFFKV